MTTRTAEANAEYMAAYRARKRGEQPMPSDMPSDTTVEASASAVSRPKSTALERALERIRELEADSRRLKRELSQRPAAGAPGLSQSSAEQATATERRTRAQQQAERDRILRRMAHPAV